MVVILFNLLRWLERWLHQHIFKVGWLLTKNFQTTTILYYTFFLPGVFLHELVYWLSAGALDVHADRSIAWPEKQEIGELRLNFVKLSSKTSTIKVGVISVMPLLVGLVFISFVANNIFDVSAALDTMRDGRLENISAGINQIMAAPDFWLWAYVLFTVSNTMMPDPSALKGWRWIAVAVVIIALPLFLIGVGDEVVGSALTGPIANILNGLSGIFVVVIVSNLVAVAILGSIEAVFERITGDSATIRNGKMIVMRREELLAQRRQERDKQRSAKKSSRKATSTQGPPSVYRLVLPIPGPPGKEPVTRKPAEVVDPSTDVALADTSKSRPQRIEPDVVDGTTASREIRFGPAGGDEEDKSGDVAAPPPDSSERPSRRNREEEPSDEVHGPAPDAKREKSSSRFARRSKDRQQSTADSSSDDAESSRTSRFGQRSRRSPSPVGATSPDDDDLRDDSDVERVSPEQGRPEQRPRRFGSGPSRGSNTEDELPDEGGNEEVAASTHRSGQQPQRTASTFGRTPSGDVESSDSDTDEEIFPSTSRFGQRPRGPLSRTETDSSDDDSIDSDVEDEGETVSNRFGQSIRRTGSSIQLESDDEDDDSEDRMLSRLSGSSSKKRATSPFGRASSEDDEITYEDVEESP